MWLAAVIVAGGTFAAPPKSAAERPISRVHQSRGATHGGFFVSETAVSEDAPLIIAERSEDGRVAEVLELLDLDEGWDGENALKPNAASAADAVKFLHAAGSTSAQLEPTLHADGCVMLELDGGADGVLKFQGDGTVSYAIAGHPPGKQSLAEPLHLAEVVRILRV
jgi:hypothetical protein